MLLSKACEYSIRALINIAQKTTDGSKVSIKDVADEIDAPMYFTAKLLQDLSRQGLVYSSKGPTGGFYLDPEGKELSLLEVVEAIDGKKLFESCGLGIKKCSSKHPCPIHNQFAGIRDSIYKLLKNTTVQELAKDISKGEAFLKK